MLNNSDQNAFQCWKIVKHTKLARVKTQTCSLQNGRVLANGPDVEIHEDRQRGECCHTQPSQHEDVRQHDELENKTAYD